MLYCRIVNVGFGSTAAVHKSNRRTAGFGQKQTFEMAIASVYVGLEFCQADHYSSQ